MTTSEPPPSSSPDAEPDDGSAPLAPRSIEPTSIVEGDGDEANVEPAFGDAPLVIGIGASAGGLEAMQQLLQALPPDTGLSFVFIQHLDPNRKTILPELLGQATTMAVVEAKDHVQLAPNTVYTSPPDREVGIFHGQLQIVEPGEVQRARLPIDFFFRSLAREQGDRAIGIVLSGTATDGTLGIRSIKGAGGLTIVQEPGSARFDGMPRSAIGTRLVDFVVPPDEMARVLVEYIRHPYLASADLIPASTVAQMDQLFMLLREQTGHDFSRYKQNTIRRRVERRMAVHQVKRLEDYLRLLQRSTAEVDELFRDLLIGVTSFFRDPESFQALEETVIPRLLAVRGGAGQIRIWVPGCSTGEEAYSLAMLFCEHMEGMSEPRKVVVFATDIDPGSIDVARSAIYPESIAADVSQARLERFFTREGGTYRIIKRIREMVIFAVQDVLRDPPFSRLDLISCRNLLIYLGPELQRKLMQVFHAVLNPGGCLSLGASERVGDATDLFAAIDKRWKIYEKRPVPSHALFGVTALHGVNDRAPRALRPVERALEALPPMRVPQVIERLLLDSYAPACVVVDDNYDIVYAHGRSGRYLELPAGQPQLNILKMTQDDVRRELRTALHKALKEKAEVVRDNVALPNDPGRGLVRLRVKPLVGPRTMPHLFLVAFEEIATTLPLERALSQPSDQPSDPRVPELERELLALRESLQSTVEEVEISNVEVRSTNEELNSANEELQSTNEELETSKEELQSVNEELMTVNTELQKKLEELSEANNDLTNLLNSTDIGTLFLDNNLRIKRFTPTTAKLISLIATDVGRPLADIVTQIVDDDMAAHAHEVLRTLMFQEAEVRTKDGRTFLRRILPYRTADNVIDGVVVTFVNITEVREAQRLVEAMLEYANSLVNAIRQPMVLLNKDGRVVQTNRAFLASYQLRREDTLGAILFELDDGRWAEPTVRASIQNVLDGGPALDGFTTTQNLPRVGPRTLRIDARRTQFGVKAIAGEQELTVLTVDEGSRA